VDITVNFVIEKETRFLGFLKGGDRADRARESLFWRALFWGALFGGRSLFGDKRNRVSLYNLCHPTNILVETRFLGRGDRLAEDEEIAFSVNMAKNDKNCHNIPKR